MNTKATRFHDDDTVKRWIRKGDRSGCHATRSCTQDAEPPKSESALEARDTSAFVQALLEKIKVATLEHLAAHRRVQSREEAFGVFADVIAKTNEIFGGVVQVRDSSDPEYPDERYVVFIAEVDGSIDDVRRLKAEWHAQIRQFVPKWNNFRLIAKRKK